MEGARLHSPELERCNLLTRRSEIHSGINFADRWALLRRAGLCLHCKGQRASLWCGFLPLLQAMATSEHPAQSQVQSGG